MAGKGGVLANKQNKAVAAQKETAPMMLLVQKMEGQIKRALPSVITGERFTRMLMTAMSTNPDLMRCTPKSFLGGMMQAAQLGLEPNTPLGQAYLIPRKNHGTLECSFEIGYKGYIDLANRSGEIRDLSARVVYENDEFELEYGLNPDLKHKPALKNRGKVIGYYAVYHTTSGGYGMEFMSAEEMEAFAKRYSVAYAKGYNTPWKTNFDEMAKKTVLKKVLKYAPLKSEFVKAINADGSIKVLPEDMNADPEMVDAPDQTDYTETTAEVEPAPAQEQAAPEPEQQEGLSAEDVAAIDENMGK